MKINYLLRSEQFIVRFDEIREVNIFVEDEVVKFPCKEVYLKKDFIAGGSTIPELTITTMRGTCIPFKHNMKLYQELEEV